MKVQPGDQIHIYDEPNGDVWMKINDGESLTLLHRGEKPERPGPISTLTLFL